MRSAKSDNFIPKADPMTVAETFHKHTAVPDIRSRARVENYKSMNILSYPLLVPVNVPVLVLVHEKEDDKIMKVRKLIISSSSGNL
jgi:hypothetical protein